MTISLLSRITCASSRLKSGVMKKVFLLVAALGLGFLAWRYFSNEPV